MVSVTVTDAGGRVQGWLEARYRVGLKTERVNFSFSGKADNGAARFTWINSEGEHGQVEFIGVPNAPDLAEVVWYGSESKQVFDEVLKRSN